MVNTEPPDIDVDVMNTEDVDIDDVDDVDGVEDDDDVEVGDFNSEEDEDGDEDDEADVDGDEEADEDDEEDLDGEPPMTGGAIDPDDLEGADVEPIEEEDLLGDDNKKITHHDEILLLHPESKFHNYDEIAAAAVVTRNENNIIVDMLHTTIPMMTKYEKTKVIGQRTKQLDVGNPPFVRVDRPTLDNSIIAEQELQEKKLPFIIQRPLPNGGFEYWHVKDLEVF
jgi:DNA-directed RNA polymerase subunit K/omega